jgi:para-nitrobenzyl esterase
MLLELWKSTEALRARNLASDLQQHVKAVLSMLEHFRWPIITLFAISLVGLSCPLAHVTPPPTVAVEGGVLEGTYFSAEQNEVAFLGVPYAAPPVGDLRWKPPQQVPPWIGTRKATEFGAACPQLPASWLPQIPWNEDCLFLNVWSTQFSASAKLPVILYLHGGSNTAGYSQMTPLGPTLSRLGVVVVSANYRLGPFGFLAHPLLTAESEHHSSGNYGLLDQLQALKWIHNNIGRFGGDPARVTVMGQSAGAADICLLMSSPMAEGLFQGAILESGECQSTLNEDIRRPQHYNSISGTGENIGERLASDLGVPQGPNAIQKLRGIPADEILKTWSQDRQIHFDAIVDGWIVPEQPAKIFAQGRELHVPVLAGSNADEATVFGHGGPKTVDEYRKYLFKDTGNYADQEFQAYPVSSDNEVSARYLQLQSDSFSYGAYSIARALTRVGQKAYLYYFTYAETGTRAPLGAYHGEELSFLSSSFPDRWEHSQDDERLSKVMRHYWVQFAKFGDPNVPGDPEWPAYDTRPNQYFELGRMTRVHPVKPQIQILEHIMDQIVVEITKE